MRYGLTIDTSRPLPKVVEQVQRMAGCDVLIVH